VSPDASHGSRWWVRPVSASRVLLLLWLLLFVPSALGLFALTFAVAAGLTEVHGNFADAAGLTLGLGVVLAILATGHWWSRRSLARQEQRAVPRWPLKPWLVLTLVPLVAGVVTKSIRGDDLGTAEDALVNITVLAVFAVILWLFAPSSIWRCLAGKARRTVGRWGVVPWLVIALVSVMAAGGMMWLRSEDLGTRLRRECTSILREGTGQKHSPEMQELWIRQCIDKRGLNAR